MKSLILITLLSIYFLGCNSQQKLNEEKAKTVIHNSKNSLDWAGTYLGVLPCADCEGIKTLIKLNYDLTFIHKSKYLGEEDTVFETKGTFSWNEEGNKIILTEKNNDQIFQQYSVGENMIIMLDRNGEKVTGGLAEYYILTKEQNDITEKYWKLMEIDNTPIIYKEDFRHEPYFILKTEENKIIGNGSCNNFNGTYELTNNSKIKFSQIAITRMACPNMETENKFMKVLESTNVYRLSADSLFLLKDDKNLLAKFEAVYLR